MATALEELLARNKSELFTLLIHYLFYTQAGKYSKTELVHLFQSHLTPPLHMKFKSIADSLIEEGIERGIERGIEQFRSLFLRQLKSRFPRQVTGHYLHLIKQAESDRLFYWIERLATASSMEDVFSCF